MCGCEDKSIFELCWKPIDMCTLEISIPVGHIKCVASSWIIVKHMWSERVCERESEKANNRRSKVTIINIIKVSITQLYYIITIIQFDDNFLSN